MKVKKVMSTVQNINSHPPDMGSVPGSATDLLGESQTNPALSLCVYVVAIESYRSLRKGAYIASIYVKSA